MHRLQVGVRITVVVVDCDGLTAVYIVVVELIEQEVLISLCTIGSIGVAQTQLTEVEPFGQQLAHRIGEHPGECCRGIEVAIVVVGKCREPVVTAGEVEEQLVLPTQIHGAVE